MQRATDWRFLQHLARRNGARFYFEYDHAQEQVVAHFGRARRRRAAAARRRAAPGRQLPELGRPAARRDRAGRR